MPRNMLNQRKLQNIVVLFKISTPKTLFSQGEDRLHTGNEARLSFKSGHNAAEMFEDGMSTFLNKKTAKND